MATTVQETPPETFNSLCPTNWPKGIERFERFQVATALKKKTEEHEVNSVLYATGDAADDVLVVSPPSDGDKKKYEAVTSLFKRHCVGKQVIFEKAQFNSR